LDKIEVFFDFFSGVLDDESEELDEDSDQSDDDSEELEELRFFFFRFLSLSSSTLLFNNLEIFLLFLGETLDDDDELEELRVELDDDLEEVRFFFLIILSFLLSVFSFDEFAVFFIFFDEVLDLCGGDLDELRLCLEIDLEEPRFVVFRLPSFLLSPEGDLFFKFLVEDLDF